MAPAAALSPEIEQLVAYFESAGISPTRSLEVAKNPKTAAGAHALFVSNQLETKGLSDKQGLLALQVAKDGAKLSEEGRNYVVGAVVEGRVKGGDQVTGERLLRTRGEEGSELMRSCVQRRSSSSRRTHLPSSMLRLTRRVVSVSSPSCSFLLPPNAHTARVGFSATPEEILQRVRAFVQPRKADLGWPTLGKTLGLLKAEDGLKWAPALEVKTATEQVYLEEFGPKVAPTKAVKVRLGMKQLEVDVLLIPFGSVQRSLRSQRSR